MLFSILTEKQGSGARFLIAAVLFVAVSMLSFLLYQQKVDKKEIRSFLHYASKIIFVLVLFDMTYISVLQKKFTAVFDFEILVIVLSLFGFIALQTYLELEPPQPPQPPATQQCPPHPPCETAIQTPPSSAPSVETVEKFNKTFDIIGGDSLLSTKTVRHYQPVAFVCGYKNKEVYVDYNQHPDVRIRVRIRFPKKVETVNHVFNVTLLNIETVQNTQSNALPTDTFNIKHTDKDSKTYDSDDIKISRDGVFNGDYEKLTVVGYYHPETDIYYVPITIDSEVTKVHIKTRNSNNIISFEKGTSGTPTTFPENTFVHYPSSNPLFKFQVTHETE